MSTNSTALLQMAHLHIDEQIRSAQHQRMVREVHQAKRRSGRVETTPRRRLGAARPHWFSMSTPVGPAR
jgi:hypothetical protein